MPAAGWRGTHTPLFAQVVASKDAHAKDKQTDTEISSGKPFNVHTETEGQKGNKQESSLLWIKKVIPFSWVTLLGQPQTQAALHAWAERG